MISFNLLFIIIIIIIIPCKFFIPAFIDNLPLEASGKSPLVSRTLLSILTDLNNAVV